jgi:DnaK suppressor protein
MVRRLRSSLIRSRSIMASANDSTHSPVVSSRYHELKEILHDRRRELLNDLQGRIRDARSDSRHEGAVLDTGESSEVEVQEAIDFALIEMKSETLTKIDTALGRVDDNTYGVCFDCGDVISERRLRALPFAVRCKDCEEIREMSEQRRMAQRRDVSPPFSDAR